MIRDDNDAMAKKEAQQAADAAEAKREFDEAQAKNEEWKTKTEEDD